MAQDRKRRFRLGLPSGFRTVRDLVSFGLGAAILAHEVFVARSANPTVVLAAAGLMGLPVALGLDESKREK